MIQNKQDYALRRTVCEISGPQEFRFVITKFHLWRQLPPIHNRYVYVIWIDSEWMTIWRLFVGITIFTAFFCILDDLNAKKTPVASGSSPRTESTACNCMTCVNFQECGNKSHCIDSQYCKMRSAINIPPSSNCTLRMRIIL